MAEKERKGAFARKSRKAVNKQLQKGKAPVFKPKTLKKSPPAKRKPANKAPGHNTHRAGGQKTGRRRTAFVRG